MLRVAMLVMTLVLVLSGMLVVPGTLHARAQEATPDACLPTTPAENTAIVQGWYDAIDAGDVEAFDAVMAPVIVQHAADFANAQDLEEVKANFAPFLAAFPDIHHEIDQVVAAGDFVAIRVVGQGTHQGEFMGIPATGRDISWSAIAIYRIECGKIAEHWSEVDAVGRLQQLGAIPEILSPVASPPAPASTPSAACPETTETENEELIRQWLESEDRGTFDARLGSTADIREAFPDFATSIDLIFGEGDRVVVRWTATGTHEGTFLGAPPTGNDFSFTANSIYRIACGQVAESWTEADRLSWFQQIGAVTWPPAAGAATPEGG